VLDEHFAEKDKAFKNATARYRHRRRGGATYRLVRYADDFVVLVFGTRAHAEGLWDEVTDVLAAVGLRLAPDKTKVGHIDEGLDFLGFRIRRHRQRGSQRRLIYSYPSKKSEAAIRRRVKDVTKQITNKPAGSLFRRLEQMTRGWGLYFRHGASKTAFQDLQHFLWWRVWIWLRNKHPKRSAKWISRRYYPHGWWPESDGVTLFQPGTITIVRYRYRGSKIPTPWVPRPRLKPA
jgi:RNA-directed DNA polymerase